jgi:translation initiation factor IF-3
VTKEAGKDSSKDTRINRMIRVPEVRVIADDGEQLGILPFEQALAIAEERGLDLVEVGATAQPPVCKIMDYGKYKYIQSKRQQEARKKQTVVEVKEIKFRPKTEEHDLQTKMAQMRKFLGEGDKVKVTMRFRGREVMYASAAMEKLVGVAKALGDDAVVELEPKMEGRIMFMVLTPGKKKAGK